MYSTNLDLIFLGPILSMYVLMTYYWGIIEVNSTNLDLFFGTNFKYFYLLLRNIILVFYQLRPYFLGPILSINNLLLRNHFIAFYQLRPYFLGPILSIDKKGEYTH